MYDDVTRARDERIQVSTEGLSESFSSTDTKRNRDTTGDKERTTDKEDKLKVYSVLQVKIRRPRSNKEKSHEKETSDEDSNQIIL